MNRHIELYWVNKVIVEFTGCVASGKTTFVGEVLKKLRVSGLKTISSTEVVTGIFGLQYIKNTTIRNILLDIFLFPQFFFSLRKNIKFYAFALKILFRKPDSFIGAVNRLRSVMRKITVNELVAKRATNDRIVIVDEGTVHSAHNIFVYSNCPLVQEDIKIFSDIVPLPDIVICMSGNKDIILNRVLTRKEPRMVFESKKLAPKYVVRAIETFKMLCSTAKIKPKLLTIDVLNSSIEQLDGYVDKAVKFILEANINACSKEFGSIC